MIQGKFGMARITITEAAKQNYKSRSTINKDVRSGKLPSFEERGVKVVDIADLIALYGEPGSSETAVPIPTTKADANRDRENEELKAELQKAQAELAEARRAIDDKDKAATEERQRLLDLVESSSKQLEDLRSDKDKLIEDMRADRERTENRDKEIIEELKKPFLKRLFRG